MRFTFAAVAVLLVSFAAGCSSSDPQGSGEDVTESASPTELPPPETLEELEEQLDAELRKDWMSVSLAVGSDNSANVIIRANGVEDALTIVEQVRDGVAQLPGDVAPIGRYSMSVLDADGERAHLSIPGSADDATIASLLDDVVTSPCNRFEVATGLSSRPLHSEINCRGFEEDTAAFVAALPDYIENTPIDAEVMGEVSWRMNSRAEGVRLDAHIDQTDLSPARQEALANAAKLLDAETATNVIFTLSDDRVAIQATMDASQAELGEELMDFLRPLGEDKLTVLLYDAAKEPNSEPLVALNE